MARRRRTRRRGKMTPKRGGKLRTYRVARGGTRL